MTSSLPDTPEGATTTLALAAAEAAHALDHGWPHTPTADELADLYRSDEDAARTLRTPVSVRCACCGGTGRVRMGDPVVVAVEARP